VVLGKYLLGHSIFGSTTLVELNWLLAFNDSTAARNEMEAFCKQPAIYPSIFFEGPAYVVEYMSRIFYFGQGSRAGHPHIRNKCDDYSACCPGTFANTETVVVPSGC